MFSKTRRHAAVMAAAALLSLALPAAPAAAAGPCQAHAVSTDSETAILLEGHYVDNKWRGSVTLICHVVQDGLKVASAGDMTSGSVAVVASDERIPLGPFTVCYELHIFVVSTMANYYTTNC